MPTRYADPNDADRASPDPVSIRLLVMDVDGVLTTGEICYDSDGREIKCFSVRDGFGLTLWHRAGLASAIITARANPEPGGSIVERRAAELGIGRVVMGSGDKGADLRRVADEAGVPLARTAYIGDDWKDIPAMTLAGFPAAPADAEAPVRETAAWVSTRPGGRGAVRELIEHLLSARGELAGLLREHGYDRP